MSKLRHPGVRIRLGLVLALAGALLGLVALGFSSGYELSGAAYIDHQDSSNGGFRAGFDVSYAAIVAVALMAGLITALRSLFKTLRDGS